MWKSWTAPSTASPTTGAGALPTCTAVNENIRFEGCVFRQLTGGTAGGIWVRNWTDQGREPEYPF